jgi:NAD(P)-dependent dehydrogenase (short-subunit alcohol dehydrogenase family)
MNRKTILITGAGAGIGKAAASLFAGKGWYVGLYDINEESVRALGETLGEDISCFQRVDVTDVDSVKTAVAHFAENTGGRMNVLLNNAGVLKTGPFQDIPLEEHHRIAEINVKGVMNCAHTAFPLLRDTPDARLINMASASGIYGIPEFTSYSASKFFVRGLTEALDLEWEPFGIKVCDIMPPFVDTGMVEAEKENNSLVRALGVKLSPEDIAKIIWQAANKNQLHWPVTINMKLLKEVVTRLPDSLTRTAVKRIINY